MSNAIFMKLFVNKPKKVLNAVHAIALGMVIVFAVRLFDFAFVFYTKVRDRVRKLFPKEKRT